MYIRLSQAIEERIIITSAGSDKLGQTNNTQTTEFMRGEPQENSLDDFRHHAVAASLQNPTATPSQFFIHTGDHAISRLELEAARNAVQGVSLFLIFSLPTVLALIFALLLVVLLKIIINCHIRYVGYITNAIGI